MKKLCGDLVDRQLIGTATQGTGYSVGGDASGLGWASWTTGDHLKGSMDDAAIFSRALSASEISELYHGGNLYATSLQQYKRDATTTIPEGATTTESSLLTIDSPELGSYKIQIISQNGAYYLTIANNQGQQPFQGTLQKGSMIAYVQDYDPTDLAASVFTVSSTASSTASITSAPPNNWTPPAVQ